MVFYVMVYAFYTYHANYQRPKEEIIIHIIVSKYGFQTKDTRISHDNKQCINVFVYIRPGEEVIFHHYQ